MQCLGEGVVVGPPSSWFRPTSCTASSASAVPPPSRTSPSCSWRLLPRLRWRRGGGWELPASPPLELMKRLFEYIIYVLMIWVEEVKMEGAVFIEDLAICMAGTRWRWGAEMVEGSFFHVPNSCICCNCHRQVKATSPSEFGAISIVAPLRLNIKIWQQYNVLEKHVPWTIYKLERTLVCVCVLA